MYLREVNVKRKDGRVVTYLRLVESYRDQVKGYPVQKVIYSFGKVTELNRKQLMSVATSILNYLSRFDQGVMDTSSEVVFSKSYGMVYLVRQLADKLDITAVIKSLLKRRNFATGSDGEGPITLAILAMIINRLMAPSSKHAMVVNDWLNEDIYLPGSNGVALHHLYRGLDFLEECKERLEEELFWQGRDLFKRKLDMVFYDTTSTYVEGEGEDDLLQYGYSRDHRSDRKQIVIGLATDKDGLPITSVVFPGNTMDMMTVEAMVERLDKFDIDTCLFVCDRGMVSEENLGKLVRAGYGYIVGVKLRQLLEVRDQVLSKPGRYQKVDETLKVKEACVDGKRYVVCLNDQEAKRDERTRKAILATLPQELEEINSGKKSSCSLLNNATKRRLVRQLKTGKFVLDKGAIRKEAIYDGKYVLRTSDRRLSTAEVVIQYKNLYRVERAFRTLKTGLDLRPLYHRVEHRIKAHVFLCVLAYYISRYAETKTGISWDKIRRVSQRLYAIKILLKNGEIIRTTRVSEDFQFIVNKLDMKIPPQILM